MPKNETLSPTRVVTRELSNDPLSIVVRVKGDNNSTSEFSLDRFIALMKNAEGKLLKISEEFNKCPPSNT